MSKWSGWDWISYGCLGVAALGLAVGAWGKENPEMFSGLPSVFSSPKWAAVPAILFALATIIFIARLLAPAPNGTAIAPVAMVTSERLIKDPSIGMEASGRISLQGRYTRPDGPLSIYVTYGSAGGPPYFHDVLKGKLSVEPRIKIGVVDHIDRNEEANLTLAYFTKVDGDQQILQWGEPTQDRTKIGVTWTSYFCFAILVWKDGKEELYPFQVIARATEAARGVPPIMVGPDLLAAHSEIDTNAKK